MFSNPMKGIILWLITSYTLYKTLSVSPLKKGAQYLEGGSFFRFFYIHVAYKYK